MSKANINFINEQEKSKLSNKFELFPNAMRIDDQLEVNMSCLWIGEYSFLDGIQENRKQLIFY